MENENKTIALEEEVDIKVVSPVGDTTDISNKMSSIILRHEDEIREVSKNIGKILDFVHARPDIIKPSILEDFDDKYFVIIGVVIIALVGMWKVTDPTILLTSIVSGLFGIATGRSMGSKKSK
jgi:hypothetical protein